MGIRPPTKQDADRAVISARHLVTQARNLDDARLLRLAQRCERRAEYLQAQLVKQLGAWDDRFELFNDPEERDG